MLLDFLERHIEHEQSHVLPALEEHYNDDEREAIGRRFNAAKARLSMKLKAA